GPVAALVTRAAELSAGDDGLQLARLTLELLRPVPLGPLRTKTTLARPGRRVQPFTPSPPSDRCRFRPVLFPWRGARAPGGGVGAFGVALMVGVVTVGPLPSARERRPNEAM